MSKYCKRCQTIKEDSEFGIDNRWDTLRAYCKKCYVEYSRKYFREVIKPKNPPKKSLIPIKEGFRFCIKCKLFNKPDNFYGKSIHTCKDCANKEAMKRYYEKHDEVRLKAKVYREAHKPEIKKRAAAARIKYNHTKYSGAKMKEYRDKLTPTYIKSRIRAHGIDNKKITPEMIEAWKTKILIDRIKKKVESGGKKICAICKKTFDLSCFYRKKYYWKGVEKTQINNVCKKCSNERTEKYKANKRKRSN